MRNELRLANIFRIPNLTKNENSRTNNRRLRSLPAPDRQIIQDAICFSRTNIHVHTLFPKNKSILPPRLTGAFVDCTEPNQLVRLGGLKINIYTQPGTSECLMITWKIDSRSRLLGRGRERERVEHSTWHSGRNGSRTTSSSHGPAKRLHITRPKLMADSITSTGMGECRELSETFRTEWKPTNCTRSKGSSPMRYTDCCCLGQL